MDLRALIFDVDGTLAETEEVHRQTFNAAFAAAGLGWSWDVDLYRRLLSVTGGRERIAAYAAETGQTVDAAALHAHKTRLYGERVREGRIALRPGVEALVRRARRLGLALAIGTTTSRANVTGLLQATLGPDAEGWFASLRAGEDVRVKKPDPEVYRLVLTDLGLEASQCVCFEDSRNGLLAAKAAGLHTVVTPGLYTADDDLSEADLLLRGLDVAPRLVPDLPQPLRPLFAD